MKKPNPFRHMLVWSVGFGVFGGTIGGGIIAVLVIFVQFATAVADGSDVVDTGGSMNFLSTLLSGSVYGVIGGAILGIILGLVTGGILWLNLRPLQLPFSAEEALSYRKRVLVQIALVSLFGTYIFVAMIGLSNLILGGIPALMIALISVGAGYRYFQKLRRFAEHTTKYSEKPKVGHTQ